MVLKVTDILKLIEIHVILHNLFTAIFEMKRLTHRNLPKSFFATQIKLNVQSNNKLVYILPQK